MLHIRPETDGVGELFPHALVFPYALFAFLHERLDTILLNLLLAVQAELLLHLDLDRQSVGIPARLTRYLISLHGPVSRNHILDNTGQDMADMRLAIGRRRSVIECVFRSLLTAFHALLENVVVQPEFLDLVLALYEILVRIHFVVHRLHPLKCKSKIKALPS